MKKISILLILTSFMLMIVSVTFVSAATTDDFDYGAVPDYDDPDANGEGNAAGALPQYDDPEG